MGGEDVSKNGGVDFIIFIRLTPSNLLQIIMISLFGGPLGRCHILSQFEWSVCGYRPKASRCSLLVHVALFVGIPRGSKQKELTPED